MVSEQLCLLVLNNTEIENSLGALQTFVGGYIETVKLATDLVIICNEEGRLIGLPFNCDVLGCGFVGPIIFASTDGEGNFVDITPLAETLIKGMRL